MKSRTNGLFAALLLAVIGVVFLWRIVPEWFVSMQKPLPLEEITESELAAGKHVQGDVYALLDSFASEQTWTENGDGSRTAKKTSKVYYIAPIGEQSFVGVECYAKDMDDHDDLVDATLSWLFDETENIEHDGIAFDGRLIEMDDELYQYMVEWFQDNEFFGTTDADEIKQYVLPYMLAPFSPGMGAMLAIGFVILGVGVLVLVVSLSREKKRKKRMEELANQPAPAYDPTQPQPDALSHLQQ